MDLRARRSAQWQHRSAGGADSLLTRPQGRARSSASEGVHGVLQADAYSGFEELYVYGRMLEAGRWAHVRRKFYDFNEHKHSPVAAEAMRRIGELYVVEAQIRSRLPEERARVRVPDRCWRGSRCDSSIAWKCARLPLKGQALMVAFDPCSSSQVMEQLLLAGDVPYDTDFLGKIKHKHASPIAGLARHSQSFRCRAGS